ncbi:MAG: hypothetical protein ORN52_11670 [Beijerinckiaceae bacterium]|nr:hypothetical protein [Beijerinckiaceae bacterium]
MSANQLNSLASGTFQSLTTAQLSAMSTASISGLSATKIGGLTTSQLSSLATNQIAAISNDGFANLSTGQLNILSSASISVLTWDQLQAMSTTSVAGLGTSFISALTTNEVAVLAGNQLSALSTAAIKALTTGQLNALDPVKLSTLSTTDVSALTSKQVAGLTNNQLAYLSTAQIATLSTQQIAGLSSTQLATLKAARPTPLDVNSAIAVYNAAKANGTLSSLVSFTIQDTSDTINNNISTTDMAGAKAVATIQLTDNNKPISLDRSVVSDNLANPNTTNPTTLLLQKISTPFTLALSNVTAQDAVTMRAPSSKAMLSLSVVDTAASISANLDKLQALVGKNMISDITVTDGANFDISLSASQLTSDAGVLNAIQNNYGLEVTGVAAADVASVTLNDNAQLIDIADTAANILKNLADINTAQKASQIATITLTDKTNPTLSIADATTLTNLVGFKLAPNRVLNIADTANNVIGQARYDIASIIANAGSVSLTNTTTPTLTLADATTLVGISTLAPSTKFNIADGGNVLAAQSKIANENVLSRAAKVQIVKTFSINDAKSVTGIQSLDKGTNYSIIDTVSNILAQSTIQNNTLLNNAISINIADNVDNIAANLDQLENLAKAGKINDITITGQTNSGFIGISADKLQNDKDAVGKILGTVVATPSSSVAITSASPQFITVDPSTQATFTTKPRAQNKGGDLLWEFSSAPISSNPKNSNPNINTFNVTLVPQNRLGSGIFDASVSAGTVNAQGTPGNNVMPFLFNQDPVTKISTGGLVKFNQTAASGSVKTFDVTFEALIMTGSNAPSHPDNLSQMAVNLSPTVSALMNGLALDGSKGESYSWSGNSDGFILAWSKQISTDSNGNGSYNININKFDVNGNLIGNTTVLNNAYTESASDLRNGNNYQWDTLSNNQLLISDGNGGVKIQSVDTGAVTGSFKPNLDVGSYGFIGNYSGLINPDNNGQSNTVILQYAGTRNGTKVVQYYSVDTRTMSVIGQSSIQTNSNVYNFPSGPTMPDGSSSIFGFQDGNILHTQLIDGMGKLVSDNTTTLPNGVNVDRYRSLGDGRFEAIWRQPNGSSGANAVVIQNFDTRGNSINVVRGNNVLGTYSNPAVRAGTSANDKITVVSAKSLVEGGAGADVLTATSSATNSTLSYEHSNAGVTVNLQTATASGGDANGDKISGFNNLIGSNFNDTLTGTHDGYVYGGGGNDTLIGDGKTTTAVYTGNRSDYKIMSNANGALIISDIRSGSQDGSDTLINIANVKFSDGSFAANSIPGVNVITPLFTGIGGFPSPAQLLNGSTVVAYTKADQLGNFKIIAADGSTSAEMSLAPFPFNINRVANLSVTATQDGGFMISGAAAGLDADTGGGWNPNSYRGPFYQFFDSAGQALTPMTLTDGNGYGNWKYGSDPVTLLPNNQILSVGHTGNGAWHITANIQDKSGTYIQKDLQVSQHGSSWLPNVKLSTDGQHALFVWTDAYGSGGQSDSSGSSVWGRVYDLGTKQFSTNEFLINQTTSGNQGWSMGINNEAKNYLIDTTSDGGFKVSYRSTDNSGNTQVLTRKIGNAATQYSLGSEAQLIDNSNGNPISYDSANLVNGNIFVAYSTSGTNGSNGGIFGKLLSANGTKNGDDFRISDATSSLLFPRVAANSDNSVTVSWDNFAGNSNDGGIHDAVMNTAKIKFN